MIRSVILVCVILMTVMMFSVVTPEMDKQWKRTHELYLYGRMYGADYYKKVIQDRAHGGTVHLLGPGGYVEGMEALYRVIQDKELNVVVDGSVYSAHAYLALVGHTIHIKNKGVFMFHHHSGYREELAQCKALLKPNDEESLKKAMECVNKLWSRPDVFTQFLEGYLQHVLTQDELTRIMAGEDVFIYSEDMQTRLCKSPKFNYKTVGCREYKYGQGN